MRKKHIKSVLIFIPFLLLQSSCTGITEWIRGGLKKSGGIRTSYNVNFSEELKKNRKVIVAKMVITYHGTDVTGKCEVRLNSDNATALSLENDGYLFLATDLQKNSLTNLGCRRSKSSPFFYYDFEHNIMDLIKNVTYVGDIKIDLINENDKSIILTPKMKLQKTSVLKNIETIKSFEEKIGIHNVDTSILKWRTGN